MTRPYPIRGAARFITGLTVALVLCSGSTATAASTATAGTPATPVPVVTAKPPTVPPAGPSTAGGAVPSTALSTPVSPLTVEAVDVANYPRVKRIVVAPLELTAQAMAAGEFDVVENGQRRGATAKALPTEELRVVLVIDTSGSMKGGAIAAAQRAAADFVRRMPADAQVAVVSFGTTVRLNSPFSLDRARTVAALTSLRVRGQTALHDGLITGARLFQDAPAQSRRVLVVLSDGGDTVSKATLADAVRALTEARVSLSVIALATGESDAAALALLTTSANGALAPATDPAALNGVFATVANSVLRRYEVEWTSSANGPTDVRMQLVSGSRQWESASVVDFPAPTVPVAPPTSIVPTPSGPPAVRVVPTVAAVPSGRRWLLLGTAAGFASALLVAGMVLWPRPPRRRLAAELGVRSPNQMSGVSKGIVQATRSYFLRAGRGHRLAALLERAGWTMDAPTAAVIAGAVSVAAALVGATFGGLATGLLAGPLSLGVCYLILKSKADRRSAKFRDQFEAALQMIINSLKSGYGASQAIETVAREAESPTSDEFRRVVTETTLGMDQIKALEACALRTKCDELIWVSEAMEVNREVGGNLSEVLVGIAGTLRARVRLSRQVKALSAEGRISAKVLLVVPIVVFLFQFLANRSALSELFHGFGLVMLLSSLVSMAIGSLWINRIVKVDF